MTLKTNLDTAPYYDDFDPDDNFHRILFRPGYAIQSRELTQLQSILQRQIELHGKHIFKNGAIVVPGEVTVDNRYYGIRLKTTFNGETIDPSQYYNDDTPVVITGDTSGVEAEVVGYSATGDQADEPVLYVTITKTGKTADGDRKSPNSAVDFIDGEKITANAEITHTTEYKKFEFSAEVFQPTGFGSATSVGTAVSVSAGVFYAKGTFVETKRQDLIVSYNDPFPSKSVGFNIIEEIVTPEEDTSLLDNSTGTTNFAAKGAHRLKIRLELATKDFDDTDVDNFIELVKIDNGIILEQIQEDKYSIIGDAMAQRTFEESGNYLVNPFRVEVAEAVDNDVQGDIFLGEYEGREFTDEFVKAQDDFLTLKIQPGMGYIQGYRVESLGLVRKDLLKARNTKELNGVGTNHEIGNYLRLTNVYGSPDISDVSGETTAYRPILLLDNNQSSRGTISNANAVGVLRPRSFEHEADGSATGTATAGSSSTNDDGVYRLYAFDVRNFVRLTMTDTPNRSLSSAFFATGGVRVTGVTSGATGFVFNDTTSFPGTRTTFTSGATIYLTNVIGEFDEGEKIKASEDTNADLILQNSSGTDLTIVSIINSRLSDARAVEMQESDSGEHFTADIILENLEGNSTSVFLEESDDSENATGGTQEKKQIGKDDEATGIELEVLKGAKLRDPQLQQSLFKLPKDAIKTLLTPKNNGASDTDLIFRRQFVGTTSSAGAVSFSAASGELFEAHSERDYTLSVLIAGGGSAAAGDIVSVASTISGTGTSTITITDTTNLGSAAKVKIIATVKKTNVIQAVKTTNLSKQLKVIASDADGAFGTRATDDIISLGRTDVYRIQAIYDSEDTSTDAVAPTLTVSDISGTFERGEQIKGATSGARGRLITTSSPLSYTLTLGEGADNFVVGETIEGTASGATATIDTDGVTAGSKVVTSDFVFDDGQKNNYYDISRLERKKDRNAPKGRMLVIYDYLSHGAGSFFSVDSYSPVSEQMTYDDIPIFVPTVTDPDDPAPASEFPLSDCLDFRPTVENIAGTSETITDVDQVTANSFDFRSRQFDGTGAVIVDTPKPDSIIITDIEFYLPKIACLYLDKNADFIIREGEPNENLIPPAPIYEAIKIAEFTLPAYTFRPTDVGIYYEPYKRYRMEDIAALEGRIDSLEYYTSLTLLEQDVRSLEVLDTNGLPRFKSGFVTDSFNGHAVGDVNHIDYDCAIDNIERELRPKTVDKRAGLEEFLTTDAARKAAGYSRKGSIITLPYDETVASNNSSQGPVLCTSAGLVATDFEGELTLTPDTDNWFETEVLSETPVYDTASFDKTKKDVNRHNANAQYGGWNDVGSAVPTNIGYGYSAPGAGGVQNYTGAGGSGGHINRRDSKGNPTSGDVWIYEFRYTQKQKRTKTLKSISHDWTSPVTTDVLRSTSQIRYVRPVKIQFVAEGLAPFTKHYIYFGGRDVGKFTTPDSLEFTSASSVRKGAPLVANGDQELKGFFLVPDTRGQKNKDKPKFETGEINFKITSSPDNDDKLTFSFAEHSFFSMGQRHSYDRTITSTKTPIVKTYQGSPQYRNQYNHKYMWGNSKVQKRFPGSAWVDWESGLYTDASAKAWVQQLIKDGVLKYRDGMDKLEIQPGYRTASPGSNERTADDTHSIPKTYTSPLMQSFVVQEEGGMYMTGVNLAVCKVKGNNVFTVVDLVSCENGVPTNTRIPYARAIKRLNPSDAHPEGLTEYNQYTKFDFQAPVYLQEGEKYAIRITSRARRVEFQYGDTTQGSKKHTSLGAMFPATSITSERKEGVVNHHLIMQTKKARFKAVSGTITLQNESIGEEYTQENGDTGYGKLLISPSPIEMTNSIKKIKVYHRDHGMYNTLNNVLISGVTSGVSTTLEGSISDTTTTLVLASDTGFTSSSTHVASASTVRLKIDNELFSGTLSGRTFSVSGRGKVGYGDISGASVAHGDGATVELYMLFGVPLNEINKEHNRIADIEMNSYTVSLTTAPTITGSVATVRTGGTDVYASENYRFETFKTHIPIIEMPGTAVGLKARTTTGTSPGGSETPFETLSTSESLPIALNNNYDLTDTMIVASPINEKNEMSSAKSLFIDLRLSTTNFNLTPIVDLTTASIFAIGNRLGNVQSAADVYTPTGQASNYRDHTTPAGDSCTTSYITKPVQLETDATALKMFLDVHKPPSATVKVLFRTLPVEGEDDITQLPFKFFNGTGLPDTGVATNATDRYDFIEYGYTAGKNDFGIGSELQPFQQFQFKVVLQGTDSAECPRIMNLRGIALAT